MTTQVERLFAFVEQTIETDLVEELAFLAGYDRTKRAMQEIVDMPDREIDLFIRFCVQNSGKLSPRRRAAEVPAPDRRGDRSARGGRVRRADPARVRR